MNHNSLPTELAIYSTETALTRFSNDIMQALDSKQPVIIMLVLLDMSAAFDTIDHTILLNILEVRYGIAGTAHQWFRSDLSDRSQKVRILGKSSDSRPLNLGVPQGSVLGPVIFTSIVFCSDCQHRTQPRPECPPVRGRYPTLHFVFLR